MQRIHYSTLTHYSMAATKAANARPPPTWAFGAAAAVTTVGRDVVVPLLPTPPVTVARVVVGWPVMSVVSCVVVVASDGGVMAAALLVSVAVMGQIVVDTATVTVVYSSPGHSVTSAAQLVTVCTLVA